MLTVEQIMSPSFVSVRPDSLVRDAIELLIERRVGGLPVVDADDRLVGILTEFALLAMAYDQDVANQLVQQHMTRDVLTVEASDSVNRVADLCIVHRVRWLPVLRSGRLVGLVSRRDVLEAIYRASAPVGV